MNILFIINSLDKSGAPKSLSYIVNFLAKKEYKISIIYFYGNVEISLDSSITIIKPNKSMKLFKFLNQFTVINNICKHNNYDVGISFSPLYINGLNKYCKRIIFADRGLNPVHWKFKLYCKLIRKIDLLVVQTPYTLNFYPKKLCEKAIIIPNYIDFIGSTCKERTVIKHKICTVGRLNLTQKRQDIIIDAMSIVIKEIPDACLYIYGEGVDRCKILKQIKLNGLDSNVKLMGHTNDVYLNICDSELFVLSSDFEGIPNVLMEAMIMNIPCISTDCLPGGAKFLLEKNRGIIINRDNPMELAMAIIKLMDNPELSRRITDNAGKYIKKFTDIHYIMEKWEEALK